MHQLSHSSSISLRPCLASLTEPPVPFEQQEHRREGKRSSVCPCLASLTDPPVLSSNRSIEDREKGRQCARQLGKLATFELVEANTSDGKPFTREGSQSSRLAASGHHACLGVQPHPSQLLHHHGIRTNRKKKPEFPSLASPALRPPLRNSQENRSGEGGKAKEVNRSPLRTPITKRHRQLNKHNSSIPALLNPSLLQVSP